MVKRITTSGMICALYIVILFFGIIPGFEYIVIAIDMGTLGLLYKKYGLKQWILSYITASILSLIIIPDLDVSLTATCLCWYTAVRIAINNSKKIKLKKLVKTIIFIVASIIIYNIAILVFGSTDLVESIPFFVAIYVVCFTIVFWMCDIVLTIFDKEVYRRVQK